MRLGRALTADLCTMFRSRAIVIAFFGRRAARHRLAHPQADAVPGATAQPVFALVGVVLALPSGIGQQLLFLLGLFAPLEAVRRWTDVAAGGSALIFALLHVPFVMEAKGDDLLASLANVVLFQTSVGLIACLAIG